MGSLSHDAYRTHDGGTARRWHGPAFAVGRESMPNREAVRFTVRGEAVLAEKITHFTHNSQRLKRFRENFSSAKRSAAMMDVRPVSSA
jgi:hypothetical protein